MADSETTLLLEQDERAVAECQGVHGDLKASAVVADVATLGSGTLMAAAVNVAVVFVLPKLLTIEAYGYWRLFSLYAAYVGFLHLGFADGALLRWAGRPFEHFRHELRPAVSYLLWQHLLVLVPVGAMAMLVLSGPFRFIAVAVVIYAMVINEVTLLQFALQSARIFRPVAVSTVAAPLLFFTFVLAWHMRWQSSYREVTLLYVAGNAVALMFLLWRANPWARNGGSCPVSAVQLVRTCVGNGWPVVMANTGVALIAFADRFAVSWAASIQDFAQYSLASSAMAVLTTAIQASGKVFFSHLANVSLQRRKTIYGTSARLLLIAWAILLPGYFVLQFFIRHALPKYLPSLAYARIMLLGIPFLGIIQILQMNYAYLHGAQRRFLLQTIVALAVGLGGTSIVAFHVGSLRLVAAVQVIVLASAWMFNEIASRLMTNRSWREWDRFVFLYLVAAVCYWGATSAVLPGWTAIAAYYAVIVSIIAVLFKTEVAFIGELLSPTPSRKDGSLGY